MQAYEFDTVISGGVIHIPAQYIDEQLSSVRVILISNANDAHVADSKKFTAMKLKTKGFRFNREEANERINIFQH